MASGRHAGWSDRRIVIDLYVRARNGAIRHAPLIEDRLVIAVVDQVLDGVGDRLLQWTAFGEGDAIGRHATTLAAGLDLATGRLHLVGGDLRVETADVCA